ncbi:MAG: 50S ribosomal protein L15 [Geminicoccaceae bacterium]
MKLNELSDNPGARTSRKRLGRGVGSGLGKTSGKGHKGAKARRSNPKPRFFEGGQMPIYRRVPKRGFANPTRVEFAEVNTGRLQAAIEGGRLDPAKTIDAEALIAAGLIRRSLGGIRLLGHGELTAAVTVEVAGATKGAVTRVEQAGGKVVVLGAPAEA